jgi:hypothetical protein
MPSAMTHRYGGGGEGHTGKPTLHRAPAQEEVGCCGAAQKRQKKACKADCSRLLPFQLEHARIELGPGQEGKHDGASARQKAHPGLIGTEDSGAHEGADD